MKKRLSIIIVSYNERQYLSEAIESCLQQDVSDYEIIIGDDGSIDGSISLIKEYQEIYPNIIKYFVMERNTNEDIIPSIRASNVIKRALTIAEGKYLLFMSGDDVILGKERLSKQTTFLENNSDYVGCYSNYNYLWPDGKNQIVVTSTCLLRSVLWALEYIHISCFVLRRDVINNVLNHFCDDTGMLFSIVKTGRVKHIQMEGFAYRQRENSIMHETDKMERNLLELLLYQDILTVHSGKRFRFSSLSRFYDALFYVSEHKELLKEQRYRKYRDVALQADGIISCFCNEKEKKTYIRAKQKILVGFALFIHLFFRCIRKIESILLRYKTDK